MLSYQHGYHAGNHADVLKHVVLCHVLDYLVRKDKPLFFLDTHGGRGSYDLHHPMTQKTGEYRDGIARLWDRRDLPAALQPYLQALRACNTSGVLHRYIGSTLLAQHVLRPVDRLQACELHPQEYLALRDNCHACRNVRVVKTDGYAALKAAMPPKERRGVVLVDPSYELVSDDAAAAAALDEGVKRFASGVYLLWYPVVEAKRAQKLVKMVAALSVQKLLQIELMVREPDGAGMAGSGMLVINPPWQLAEGLRVALPWLVQQLAPATGSSRLVWLAGGDEQG